MGDSHTGRGYQVLPFPRVRQLVVDAARLGHGKHTIRGLLDVDVTQARQHIRAHKAATGETLSFTAFILSCLGQAVDADKSLHAYRDWRNRLIVFDDVDVATMFEVEAEGAKLPVAHVVRAVNRRKFRDIHEEIRSVQRGPAAAPNDRRWRTVRWFLLLPGFVRALFYWAVIRNPHAWKANVGTVTLTAVGMFGTGGGWGINLSPHTLGITLGGVAEKPAVVDGRVEIRECLSLTVDFDHDIVDGAPAARFVQKLKELIEACYGLTD